MIAVLLALLASATPFRGNRLVAIDSNLVLGTDTLHATSGCTLGACASCTYRFRESTSSSSILAAFPGSPVNPITFAIHVGWSSQSGSWSPGSTCTAGVNASPPLPFLGIVNGRNTWALAADTLLYRISTVSVVQGTPVMPYSIVEKPVLVRWNWAPYDIGRPLVRWTDTVRLWKDQAQPRGLRLFTTRDSVRIDSITPALPSSQRAGKILSLSVMADSTHRWTLGFSQTGAVAPERQTPPSTLPPGTEIRFLDGSATERGDDILWLLWSQGRAIDTIVVHSTIPISDKVGLRTDIPGRNTTPRTRDALGRKPASSDRIRQFEALFGP